MFIDKYSIGWIPKEKKLIILCNGIEQWHTSSVIRSRNPFGMYLSVQRPPDGLPVCSDVGLWEYGVSSGKEETLELDIREKRSSAKIRLISSLSITSGMELEPRRLDLEDRIVT
jgi:hypothetical protein